MSFNRSPFRTILFLYKLIIKFDHLIKIIPNLIIDEIELTIRIN